MKQAKEISKCYLLRQLFPPKSAYLVFPSPRYKPIVFNLHHSTHYIMSTKQCQTETRYVWTRTSTEGEMGGSKQGVIRSGTDIP